MSSLFLPAIAVLVMAVAGTALFAVLWPPSRKLRQMQPPYVSPAESHLRCRGQCCRSFVMGRWEDTGEEIAQWLGGGPPPSWLEGHADAAILKDMLVPQGQMTDAEAVAKYGLRMNTENSAGLSVHRFTCRHLQSNGDCGIYHSRPYMCRVYASGDRGCEYLDCPRHAGEVCSDSQPACTQPDREAPFAV